jgi:uncharacterized membrane protein (DUF485 family)
MRGREPRATQPTGAASEGRFERSGAPVEPGPAERLGAPHIAAIAHTRAYRQLTARRRAFTLGVGGGFVALFAAFLILSGWARDWMGTTIYKGLTVGYVFAVAVIVGVWLVAYLYSRASNRVFGPLAEQAREEARR